MDDSQAAFASQYSAYSFDIDMMKVRFPFLYNYSLQLNFLLLALYGSIRWS